MPCLLGGYAEAAGLVQDAGDRLGGEVLAPVRVVGIGVGGATVLHGAPHPLLDQAEPGPELGLLGIRRGGGAALAPDIRPGVVPVRGLGTGLGLGLGEDSGFGGVCHGWRSPRRRRAGAGRRSRGPAKPSGPASLVPV